ncbi:hypothetical protein TWF225_007511 [Orbilia oligospora]|nr:hypothetical protein TWF225_007511 [Orbilia oligospora]KAF3233614.1 hypothetical protein TWF128_002940 [Orbilia oligospora]KAF3252320.1 hypothetical protein TWF217_007848 [Orbilia oligospora]KAF3275484.1 hypothetical protein TWF132_002893 [Orbilia oligospora]
MPLGFERLNERVQRPNKNINFIEPLKGPDHEIAMNILERVAAIVYPIMKKHNIIVMKLEEFPPNKEFWGRNFNAGEVIQLVLKNRNGSWLPISMIQSVMLHELAHNTEMNHSRRFHAVRLRYVAELEELKRKGYTGEGFWGKGNSLDPSVNLTNDRQIPEEDLPADLCGGVYRRVKKKRKKVDYQEQKKKRIVKKFGSLEGNAVGGDDDLRQKLEKGKKTKGKPRVAASARGRDLRAEAALKRFETQKKEDATKKDEEEEEVVEVDADIEEEGEELVKLQDDDIDLKAMREEMSALTCSGSQIEPSKDTLPDIKDIVAASSGKGSKIEPIEIED